MNCAPNVDVTSHYTCFEIEELREIALAFNLYIQKKKTLCDKQRKACAVRKLIDVKETDKRKLWESIYNRLNKICKYEYCWIDQAFVKNIRDTELREKIKYFTFKPKMTKTPKMWLSTKDINAVLQQYQELDSSFKFLGALPCDFYLHVKVRYGDIKKYKRVGIVFNLDTHDKRGSHWVAFMIDNTIKTIEYFDSVANPPNRYIRRFIKYLIEGILQGYTYLENKYLHQLEDSECGVYAIYFIVQRLLGKRFSSIASNRISDDHMNKFRSIIFRSRT